MGVHPCCQDDTEPLHHGQASWLVFNDTIETVGLNFKMLCSSKFL